MFGKKINKETYTTTVWTFLMKFQAFLLKFGKLDRSWNLVNQKREWLHCPPKLKNCEKPNFDMGHNNDKTNINIVGFDRTQLKISFEKARELQRMCLPGGSFWSCDMLCVSQGMLIECLGRKVLIIGGYMLMSICCILFTLTLTFQVITLRHCKKKKKNCFI